MTNPLEEEKFDRFLRQVMQATPESCAIANLAQRSMQRAKALESSRFAVDATWLSRCFRMNQLLMILTAAGVIALAIFAADQLFLSDIFGTVETPFASLSADAEAVDVSEIIESEQMAATAFGLILIASVFLAVALVLSREPYSLFSSDSRGLM